MAIEAFIGNVGGGKSYNVVLRMLTYMSQGGRAVSNIRLKGYDDSLSDFAADSPCVAYLEKKGWQYQPKQYVYISFDDMVGCADWFARVPAGRDRKHRTLLVIDESTDLFDNLDRDKIRVDSKYRELFRFLRLSRHAHVDVVFICQDLSSINSRLRGLICGGWRSTDMQNFRIAGLRLPFPLDVFLVQQLDRRMSMETRRLWLRKDPDVFGCYESEVFGSKIGVAWDGVEIHDGSITIRGKKMSRMQKLLLFVTFCLSVVSFALLFDLRGKVSASQLALASTNVVSVASVPVSGVPAPPADSSPFVGSAVPLVAYKRGRMSFCTVGAESWVTFDGVPYHLGKPTEYGTVIEIAPPYYAVCNDSQGNATYLLPTTANRSHAAASL
jgi:zona occludens toxin (predicted ATPase)